MEKQVVKYDITSAAIEKMRTEYMPLTVQGPNDEPGLMLVHQARMEVKGHRVEVEKRRKELKADALAWGKKVDSEAKRITALLLPIETHLQTEEDKVTKELERIRQEKIAAEEKRVADIKAKIATIQEKCHPHFVFGKPSGELTKIVNGLYEAGIDIDEFMEFTDQATAALEGAINGLNDAIGKRKVFEAEEEARKAETEQLEKIRKEQAAEAARLKAIADEQAAKQKAIDDERRAIEAEKRAEQERKNREEFERKAKEEARIQAEKEARQRAEREEAERKAKEEAEAAEVARQKALEPDKEKLFVFVDEIRHLTGPDVKSKAAREILSNSLNDLSDVARNLKLNAEEL